MFIRVKDTVFPGVMYGYESWTIKKAEHQRIDAFELWFWRRLKSPSDSKEIKPVNPKANHWRGWCWNWSSKTLATGHEELTHWKRHWWWERLKAAEGDDREWNGWMTSPTQGTRVWASSRRWWRTGKPGLLYSPWGHKESDTTEQLNHNKSSLLQMLISTFKLSKNHLESLLKCKF